MMIRNERAVGNSRIEPADSLDYFPTPPWATRALFEHVLLGTRAFRTMTVEEPACGEGHMAYVLEEYFGTVRPSDIFDYGIGAPVRDFTDLAAWSQIARPDWIITNPPFGSVTLAFMTHALRRARTGVAMFIRTTQLEGIHRYRQVYRPHPPAIIAPFVERVPIHKGRWEPDGDTQTAYVWIVWRVDRLVKRAEVFWIPPVCRDALHYTRDVDKFGKAANAGDVEP